MSLTAGIETYFLRIYAAELIRSSKKVWGGWGPFGEAVFQTGILVTIPIAGAGSAAIVLLRHTSLDSTLSAYHGLVLGASSLSALAGAYLFVWKLVRKYRDSPQLALAYGTSRDRRVGNLQFWIVLMASLMLPWLVAVLIKLSG